MKRSLSLLHLIVAIILLFSFQPFTCFGAEARRTGDFQVDDVRFGDFDTMDKEHFIRFLVPYSKTFFFLDRAQQKGLSHDIIRLFEQDINKKQKKGHVKIKAVIIPTSRDKLLDNLVKGLGDVAIGNLTITQERRQVVNFTEPLYKDAREVVVTSKKSPSLNSVFDLSGKEVFVRKSSSYYSSLLKVNDTLKATGKPVIDIKLADEYLEDEDLLEMINAEVVSMTVVDLHKAEFWNNIFSNIKVQDGVAIRTGGQIAWAFRKESPLLKKELDAFVRKNKVGTLHGNMLAKRYLENTGYITNNTSSKAIEKFDKVIEIVKKYADQYSFDWLMVMALAYQESKLDNSRVSNAGAIGIMQILPSTAADRNVNIKNIRQLQQNIHAGVKYLRFMADRYYDNQGIDDLNRHLFAFASYNAGPARIAKLRKEATKNGLNPNVWFNNVELIAAKKIGRETVQYVSNIYKYYIAYKLVDKKKKIMKAKGQNNNK